MQECCKSCDKTLKLMFLPFFLYVHFIQTWYVTTRRLVEKNLHIYGVYIAQFARLHIPHVTRKVTVYKVFSFYTYFKSGKKWRSVKKLIKYIQKFFFPLHIKVSLSWSSVCWQVGNPGPANKHHADSRVAYTGNNYHYYCSTSHTESILINYKQQCFPTSSHDVCIFW